MSMAFCDFFQAKHLGAAVWVQKMGISGALDRLLKFYTLVGHNQTKALG